MAVRRKDRIFNFIPRAAAARVCLHGFVLKLPEAVKPEQCSNKTLIGQKKPIKFAVIYSCQLQMFLGAQVIISVI